MNDIIFVSCKDESCKFFTNQMQNEFEMSMIGELAYFFCLHINQLKSGIFYVTN